MHNSDLQMDETPKHKRNIVEGDLKGLIKFKYLAQLIKDEIESDRIDNSKNKISQIENLQSRSEHSDEEHELVSYHEEREEKQDNEQDKANFITEQNKNISNSNSSKNEDNSIFFPSVSNITEVSDKNNIAEGCNELEMLLFEKKKPFEEKQNVKIIQQPNSKQESEIEIIQEFNFNNENKELIDFELSEDNDSDENCVDDFDKSNKSSSSEIDIRNNSNPNDDADDSIQSDESKTQHKNSKPNLFIKIEEDQSSKTDSSKANDSNNNKLSNKELVKNEEIKHSPNQKQVDRNRFKKINEDLSKISYQKDLEQLIASPKEESMLSKFRYLKYITEEIKIIDNSDEDDKYKEFGFDKYNKSGSIQLKIEDDSEKVCDENCLDELESFREEHNKIIQGETGLNTETKQSNSFELHFNKEYNHLIQNVKLKSEQKQSILSSSFDEKYSLSISSINDEITHKK